MVFSSSTVDAIFVSQEAIFGISQNDVEIIGKDTKSRHRDFSWLTAHRKTVKVSVTARLLARSNKI